MCDVMNAVGAHELITDTPDHRHSWADFAGAQMARLLGVYRARLNDLRRDTRFRHVMVLKNHGAVWSRYQHAHSHVIATPFTPKRIEEELAGARDYHRMRERCVFCDQVSEEVEAGIRVIDRHEGIVTFAPFASAHPYEMWVSPNRHAADFGTITDRGIEPLAAALVDALARLRSTLGDVAYSVALHTGAVNGPDPAPFHWHWEIAAHLGQLRGMEWGTGLVSNPIPPEEAASQLRGATPQSSASRS
jgi:UDPglucose--hexose-1-phosphate uridylyltransferase